jgi:hypothetical protein
MGEFEVTYFIVPAEVSDLKVRFPKICKYFLDFYNDLINRGGNFI